uniref:Metallo-beta-lactamase domain-containing protein n=1 Tax=Knufia peltigerae TaxID=1002370 RepID=A0AA39CQI3_9EURO|nr:hypothetical protein H2204_013915 [Knufia peltigerae]
MSARLRRDDMESAMAWLSLLLFLPWFILLGSLYWLFPRQPRTARRRLFDGATLALALALSIVAMLWGHHIGLVQPGAGPIWPQVLAVLYAYGAFLARPAPSDQSRIDHALPARLPWASVPDSARCASMTADPSIHTIDTGFQRPDFDAAYLIIENGRAAFVDCGTGLSLPAMLQALTDNGLGVEAVDWLLLTHVHLDHAGGAGLLMQQLPNARAVLHPRGAPHMIDPTRLIAGATAVYGAEEIARSYGRIEAIPEQRVVVAEDGQRIDLAGRELVLLHTPGHALHHYCVWDARSRSWFTGDTFGISYRELDSAQGAFIFPTSSPVQFDPDAMKASIQRMLGYAPQAMYLTHYGRVEQVEKLAEDLFEQIDAMTAIGRQCDGRPDRHRCLLAALQALYLERAQQHGCALDQAAVTEVLAMDIELNAQGLACWLDRASR